MSYKASFSWTELVHFYILHLIGSSYLTEQDGKKMPQSGVGSMQGSNERTHIFSQGGGRTHNVIQRTDTQIFFYKRNETD